MTYSTMSHGETQPPVSPSSSPITVVHEYRSAYNAVVEPDKYVACSRYFLRRWMPDLGHLGTCIVLALRSLGYYNPSTGERRDGIEIELTSLAALAGTSVATLKREFGLRKGQPGQRQNPCLHLFVQKESQYSRDKTTGVVLRRKNIYRVMMDDPIHPDDADFSPSPVPSIVHRRRKPIAGYVYLLEGGGFYKIGKARDVDQRMQQIFPKLPFECRLLHAIPHEDCLVLEQEMHQRFANKRVNGEWFRLSQEDVRWFRTFTDNRISGNKPQTAPAENSLAPEGVLSA